MTKDALYEDLVISILAVNSLPVDKVYPLRDGLRKHGLFDSETVKNWDHETACQHLLNAGYKRGPYFGSILASRLQELALFAAEGGLTQLLADVNEGRREKIDQGLLKIHGVGPVVVRNFWLLQED